MDASLKVRVRGKTSMQARGTPEDSSLLHFANGVSDDRPRVCAVGSSTGMIRSSVLAFSAFLSSRYPKSLTIVSGTGLSSAIFG
jgi:hypothetical protein